jgi:mRNA interferase RelE/StbE
VSEFTVVWSKRARKHLGALDTTTKMRVLMRVEQARGDPLRFFEPLKGTSAYKLRVGDWRVVANVRLGDKSIEAVAIGHRRNVYGG